MDNELYHHPTRQWIVKHLKFKFQDEIIWKRIQRLIYKFSGSTTDLEVQNLP